MQVRTNFVRIRGHDGDEFAGDLGGFDAGKTNAKVAGEFGDALDEICQADPFLFWAAAVPLDAIVAEMDAGENHFAIAGGNEALHFVQNVLNGAAAEMGPHLRNDAEGAVKQAAILD